jgi:hypothetical protein
MIAMYTNMHAMLAGTGTTFRRGAIVLSLIVLAMSDCVHASDCTSEQGPVSACTARARRAAGKLLPSGKPASHVAIDACPDGELCLTSTVGTDLAPDACAATHTVDVAVGDQVNFCYAVVNHTGLTLSYQSLDDGVYGMLLDRTPRTLRTEDSLQFNRIVTVGETHSYAATWTAQDLLLGYSPAIEGGACTDRIFADGFDQPLAPCSGEASQFIDITGAGTPLGLTDEDSFAVTLPFPIDFYGTLSDRACIDNNGFVLIGVTECPAYLPPAGPFYYENEFLPAMDLPGPAILPLWDDFGNGAADVQYGSGDVYYETHGVAPNRQFIVEWAGKVHAAQAYLNEDAVTFELILGEDGTIRFEYPDVSYTAYHNFGGPGGDPDICDGGVCATIGLQHDARLFDPFSAFEASVTDQSGIVWTRNHPAVFTASDTATVNVGAPEIVIDPSAVAGTVAAGSTTTIQFAIENHGLADLHWNSGEAAPSNLHFAPPGSRYAIPLGNPFRSTVAPAEPKRMTPFVRRGANDIDSTIPAFANVWFSVPPTPEFYTLDIGTGGDANFVNFTNGTAFALRFADGDFSKAYALGKWGAEANLFAAVATLDGTIMPIGMADPGADADGFSGFAIDPTTGAFYAIGTTCGTSSHLYAIDRYTGAASLVGELPDMPCAAWIAISPEGFMYALDVQNDAIYAIDKTNAATSLKGSIGFDTNNAQDADFDQATGILYWAALNEDASTIEMRTVDLDTGATTLLYPMEYYAVGLALETESGPCGYPQDLPWLSLSATTGTTPPQGSSPIVASIDARQAASGDVLQGFVCTRSNDPLHRTLATPISVSVQ